MNADGFRTLITQIEAWEASGGAEETLREAPFFPMVAEQRLTGTVRKLGQKLTPTQRAWLWAKVKTRLAALVTHGSPRRNRGKADRGEWQIKIPAAPCGWLNSNHSLDRRVAARLRAEWRGHVYKVGQAQRRLLPSGLEYVKVDLQFQVKTYTLRDNANLHPTAKPIVDAFGPKRTYPRKRPGGNIEWVHEPGLGIYVGDDPTHMAGGGAFLDWFDESYSGPLDGIVWMRIIDLSPR
jgi:hypothetical protein